MDQAQFKVIFKVKYIPRALQNAKCVEFEQLKQTGNTVTESEEVFTNLAEYAPHLVATNEMSARIWIEVQNQEGDTTIGVTNICGCFGSRYYSGT